MAPLTVHSSTSKNVKDDVINRNYHDQVALEDNDVTVVTNDE